VDPRRNPYSPGAGLRPPALVGRESDIEAFEILIDRATAGRSARSLVFHGLRGVGKTVLLNELAGRATERGWLVISLEAEHTDRDEFTRALAFQLANAARKQRGWFEAMTDKARRALGSISSFQFAVGIEGVSLGVERAVGYADSGRIQSDLVDLAETVSSAAAESGTGVAVLVDEMQELTTEQMSAVCRSCHRAGQSNLPWFVIGGGLPNLPTRLSESESYAERLFEYRPVDRLNDASAELALTKPASDEGVEWHADAARFVLDESRGYPFFIQQFGSSVWDAAIGDIAITQDDALIGVTEGQRQLDAGFYASRWERATRAERALLRAMSDDDGAPSRMGDIASRLGTKTTSLGPARANLIAKGIVYPPEHGMLAYTVPGMADYVRRILAAE
jgi:hypothetical protein